MYICRYVDMYICIHVYMYICTYVYMYVCQSVYMCKCVKVYMYICIHTHTYIHIYIYICIHVHIYIYVYMHTLVSNVLPSTFHTHKAASLGGLLVVGRPWDTAQQPGEAQGGGGQPSRTGREAAKKKGLLSVWLGKKGKSCRRRFRLNATVEEWRKLM